MKVRELFEDEDMGQAEVVQAIKHDCRFFLNSKPGGLMFRGMKRKPQYTFVQSVRTDRKPRNMKYEVHEAIDDWFKSHFGFKARSEAVFVSGSFADAKSYGDVYAVFPIGDFEFVWSPDIPDLFITLHNTWVGDVKKILDESNYKNDELHHAVSSEYEIMVHCRKYYAVPMKSQAEADAWAEQVFES